MKDKHSPFRYQHWVNSALLEVIKKTIVTIEKFGLYKNLHFFITFKTNQKNIKLPNYLKEKYPKTMTIVLQNQFYNIKTNNIGFGLTLYFSGKPEDLFIPWNNITQLIDPVTPISLNIHNLAETEEDNSKVKVIKFPKQEN